MVVEGGMGVVTQQLATKAMTAGAAIHTATPVKRIEVQDGRATGVCAVVRLWDSLWCFFGGGGAFYLRGGKRYRIYVPACVFGWGMQLLDMISPCTSYAALLRTSVLSYMVHM